jgi:hypothetical protein
VAGGVVVAGVALTAALVATTAAGVPLRDPGGVTIRRLLTTVAITVALVGAQAALGARRGTQRPRWSRPRLVAVAVAIVSFHVTYLAYRNLKSVVPLLRPDAIYDHQLNDIDRALAGGHEPGDLLHSLLGTGVAAHVLSPIYMAFFLFVPASLAASFVLMRRPETVTFYATALALTWLLGAASYFLLPSIGPFDVAPRAFADLPVTAVTHLQDKLTAERGLFLRSPGAPGAAQSIGAFASLHVAVLFTAGLAGHLLGWSRPVKIAVWTLAGLTTLATIYFGWHYLLDDVAGVAIAVTSLVLAAQLTGLRRRTEAAPSP